MYTTSASSYGLDQGANELVVDFLWSSEAGLKVTKRFTFTRGSYVVGIDYLIDNNTSELWTGRIYEQLQRTKPKSKRSLIYTFTGAAISTPEKRYEKFDFDDLEDAPLNVEVKDGWVGILEHYFVSALIPPAENLSHFYSIIIDQSRYVVGYWGPTLEVPVGSQGHINSSIFIGPKLQEVLHDVAPRFGVDSRFRRTVVYCETIVCRPPVHKRHNRELGLGHHYLDLSFKARLLSVVGCRVPINGQHAAGSTANAGNKGTLR